MYSILKSFLCEKRKKRLPILFRKNVLKTRLTMSDLAT